ncbi:hypothetical protein A6E01_19815 (plasmid) [Vibrio breoganii]|uniref:Uncharacterized protein n=1 Tax=Vibrio breoganii TaxID=553239 RepID=A0AAN0XZN8_9VIBR|nr:hypothetical protein [Vibrio breoganii]ANO35462.1 hypothetical protein A6E01_19815 [Vibrio breoganii]PML13935.1 hypothetical protein BCT84_12305 [Vibrio breoganii]
MAMTISNPSRVFVIGATRVADPAPNQNFADAYALLQMQPNYAVIRHTMMHEADGVLNDKNELIYTVPLIPAKHNG